MSNSSDNLFPNRDANIENIDIQQEMQQSYLDYAMSVIVARALPDVRDGLKPVHRRILYAMKEGGYDSTKAYRKSARIVGDVMGKYHPHGDQAIYDSMVRMAQDFSMRVPLVDGHGNFGSMDGDKAAAMRYTEARMSKVSEYMVHDLDKKTVDFSPNYDESLLEPMVLPASFPNLLVNGSGGIAVGMVTNIPPHNLKEVVDATIALIRDPSLTSRDLMQYIHGPDFPTGGMIRGRGSFEQIYTNGRGSIMMQSKTQHEILPNKREAIIVTETPYQVNKAKLVEAIAYQVREKIVEDITEVRDESNREGVRIVIELKRDANYDVVLNQLYKFTSMQQSFGVHMLALHRGRPLMMSLRQMLSAFTGFRDGVIVRRTTYDLHEAKAKAHILLALLQAVSFIDVIVQTIRAAEDPAAAKQALLSIDWDISDVEDYLKLLDDEDIHIHDGKYNFTQKQAKAILELRLQRLTGMERKKIETELRSLAADIEKYMALLESKGLRSQLMEEELKTVVRLFGSERKTMILDYDEDQKPEDFITKEDMVVTLTQNGYVKRVPLDQYRVQRRGGKGRMGMATIEGDTVVRVLWANTHTNLLFFSNFGQCYQLKLWQLPLSSPQARGKALVNILPLSDMEKITALMPVPEESYDNHTLVFVTNTGHIRRNRFEDFSSVRSGGKIAMKLNENEKLIGVMNTTDMEDVLLLTSKGLAIRFPVSAIRIFQGRSSIGVRAIKLRDQDMVVGADIIVHSDSTFQERETYLNVVNAKRRVQSETSATPVAQEDIDKVKMFNSSKDLQAMQEKEQWILTISSTGYGLLASTYDYRVTGRGGKGVRNINLTKDAHVVGSYLVSMEAEIVIVTSQGHLMRTKIEKMIPKSRGSKGIRMFDLAEQDYVISVSVNNAPDPEEDNEDSDLMAP